VQEVEGIRKDVTVIVGQYLYTTWYIKQLRDLTSPEKQRPYESGEFPELHPDRTPPTTSITNLDDAILDGVAAVQLPEDVTLPFPRLAVTYPSGMVLDRAQQLALRVITDSGPERPIFFSSAGGLMQQLGLDRWGVRHGITTKLDLRSIEDDSEGLVLLDPEYGGDWYDLEQSLTLYNDVYQFRGLKDRDIWPDRSTSMMPMQYYVVALQLSNGVLKAGMNPSIAQALMDDAEAFQIVAQGGRKGTPRLPVP
jgi:hypothetical protein